ncbi:MAG: M24 family metallopeptidase [Deltaproteobacteria bacterium]|nr:M24 family metallopeptidase [Deltaproteobacteria bacterium]MBI3386759.1 M24 family metallopeptidase [Deltaproteobacteria bacterium]
MNARVEAVQAALQADGIDAWLFYDFRGSDPLAYRVLDLPQAELTRRWFYCVPATGSPRALVSAVEPDALAALPGEHIVYRDWRELRAGLTRLLHGHSRVAMQYSPECAIPYISRVDAGTIELVRTCGVTVVSSADLVQRCEAVWTPAQYAGHCRAAHGLRATVDETFDYIAERIRSGGALDEVAVQHFMLECFRRRDLVTSKPPIVAVDAHSANPHYGPTPTTALPIRRDSFVLLDLWAKEPDGLYADITWTGVVSDRVPPEPAAVFAIVRDAREAAITHVRSAVRAGRSICGAEVDDVARAVIQTAGYGDYFVHRTGHSIGTEVHGNGANIDGFENPDHRRLLPHTCFSIEPGIYLPGQFGVRSEVDVYLSETDAEVTGAPAQDTVVAILAEGMRTA